MKLIGILDSPYVRRVAISAKLMGLLSQHAEALPEVISTQLE